MTEQRILENITNDSYTEDPHLITVLSTTLDEDVLVTEETEEEGKLASDSTLETAHPRSRKEKFLASVEDKMDKTNQINLERLEHLKVQVVDHLKMTKERLPTSTHLQAH